MNAPQAILFILWATNLLIMANLHGKEKIGKHNFWTSLIAISINAIILYNGGFFDNLK